MVATISDISLVRGDTWIIELSLYQDAAHTLPYPIDDADELKSEIRKGTGTPVLAEFLVEVVNANTAKLTLAATESEGLPYGGPGLRWDLQGTWVDEVHTLAGGKILVIGDITESDLAVPGTARAGR